jgi:hypothetical protein
MCNFRRAKLGFLRAAHWAGHPRKPRFQRVAAVITHCLNSVQVRETSVRDVSSKELFVEGAHRLRDASFKGRNVRSGTYRFMASIINPLFQEAPHLLIPPQSPEGGIALTHEETLFSPF